MYLKTRIKNYTRTIAYILSDITSVYLAIFIGLFARFEGIIPDNYLRMAVIHGVYISAIFIALFFAFGLYKSLWEYAGSKQFLKLIGVCILGTLMVILIEIILPERLPLSVLAIQFMAILLLTGGIRISFRIMPRVIKTINNIFLQDKSSVKRVMIVGGGDAGSIIIREMLFNPNTKRVPVIVVDDDRNKQGRNIYGVKIEYGSSRIPELVKKYDIYEIIFAIPSADIENKNEILKICAQTRCNLLMMPSLSELQDYPEYSNLSNIIRKVQIEDLLGRKEVSLDFNLISGYLREKIILITGGGGSIGSEIARQIIKFYPKKLIILDNYENNAARLLDELRIKYGRDIEIDIIIASIRDIKRLEQVFSLYKPYVVFHAAAHKHVPLMEASPCEAVENNVLGTLNVAKMADKYKTKRFVLISTDKAVNPTSVMGATKRIAEMIIQSMNNRSETEFVSVRFGNVLDSNGSVIPLFKKQIEAGGPITVTHSDIRRYFMTIPEAAQLVIQAGAMAKGGEIFVLDMGEPIKIMDLANNLIRLSGLIPEQDIKLEIIGLRPGEKMFEEFMLDEEGVDKTQHEKIFIGRSTYKSYDEVMMDIESLVNCMDNPDNLRKALVKVVPTYTYKTEVNTKIDGREEQTITSS
jgi:FlaA1/EpsC-like NDP-sugar epimerase